MNDAVRIWHALDVQPGSDLFQAALTDFEVSAIDERSSDDWRVFFVSAEERDRAAAALRIDFPTLTIDVVDVPDENWAARSQASLRAIRAGRIVVAPPWDVPEQLSSGDIAIVIQPSMGFGTGHHATTRLCLEALQRLDVHGKRVIDVGTGSGVLAIAASLLGATAAEGFDDDPDAITSARENLELNSGAQVALTVDDLRAVDRQRAGVVLANLTGGLLAATASLIRELVTPGGHLILSGLMVSEEPEVVTAFEPLAIEHRAQEDEWLCLTVTLRPPSPSARTTS